LTLPVWLIKEIDKRRGLTKRSTFIAAILSEVLGCKKEEASEAPEATPPQEANPKREVTRYGERRADI
jgi:hypothetical protein